MLNDVFDTNPGDSFPSAEAAAGDAFNYINTLRDCHTNEYAGWIYKEWSLFGSPQYTYDEPLELSPTGGVMPPMPSFHDTVAMFHNHPPIPGYDSDNYSPADEDTADYNSIPSYLEIPSGVIKRYSPESGHPRQGKIETVGNGNRWNPRHRREASRAVGDLSLRSAETSGYVLLSERYDESDPIGLLGGSYSTYAYWREPNFAH